MDPSRLFGEISSLARPVDLRQPSNRFALLAAGVGAVAGVVGTLVLTDLSVVGAIWRGVAYGVAAFLAWAVGRELDPDEPAAARYAVFLYVVAAWAGPPALAATLALLLAARLLTRSTGRPPTRWDLAAVVVVAGLAAATPAGFVVALGLAYALYADTRLPEPASPTEQHVAAALTAVTAVAVTLATGSFWSSWRGPDALEALLVLAALAAITVFRVDRVEATGDLDRRPLLAERVLHSRWLVLGAALAAVLWAGAAGIGALAPVFAAIVGVGVAATRRPHGAADPTTG